MQNHVDNRVDNPYVGPRTFTREESDRFFGREQEARDLLSLVISERLVLFYAQSGAGKSSLINARLVPQLQEAGFAVLPIGRVSGALPERVSDVDNIFVFNLLLSLDQSEGDPGRFTHTTLTDFLTKLTTADGEYYYYDETAEVEEHEADARAHPPHVLIIDQFEEIITAHRERWEDRAGFFRQLDQAMAADPLLWVVLVLREDHVAALDSYAHLLSDKLRARFYMQRMGKGAALAATQEPAAQAGRPFALGVAEALVDNLGQIRVQGETTPRPGQFIEPVQLQVVCYQLWENLKGQPTAEITHQDRQALGDVDTALAQFYEQAIARVLQDPQIDVSEPELRDWFNHQLITEAGTRGTVYQGEEKTGGLANEAIRVLEAQFLIRAEPRAGGRWYELVHDRFVKPILEANQAWRSKQPLIQVVQAWTESGRSTGFLLEGESLQEALATNWQSLGPLVQEFLEASQAAEQAKEKALQAEKEAQRQRELKQARALAEEQEKRAEEQARAAAKLRRLAMGLAGVGIVAVLLAIVAGVFSVQSRQNANLAATREAQAQENASTAEAASTAADEAREIAITRYYNAVATATRAQAELELEATQVALAAARQADYATLAAASQAQAEAEATAAAEARENLAANLEALLSAASATPEPPVTTPTLSPTATPTSQVSPTPETGPTATPTTTLTPTPDQAAMATAEALQAVETQLAQVQLTQMAAARSTPTPTPSVTPTPSATPIPFPPPGRIVFVSTRLGNKGTLFLMNVDGSGDVIPLIPNSEAFDPSYSPGIDSIVWSTAGLDMPGEARLYTMNPDIGVVKNIGGQARDDWWQPAFSPDGQRVAFVSARDGNPEIYLMNADGSGLKRLTNHPDGDFMPAWSPDGERIAFVSYRDGQADIWLMDVNGGNLVRLTSNDAHDVYPAWSPDGRQIAFGSDRDGNVEIYTMDVDGRNQRNLTNSPFDENDPAWSPDGNWLAFSRFTTNNEIFVMTIAGDHVTNRTNHPAVDLAPIWLPPE